jgi:hypothetical protein
MHPPQRKDLTIFRRALLPRSRTTLGSLDSRPTLTAITGAAATGTKVAGRAAAGVNLHRLRPLADGFFWQAAKSAMASNGNQRIEGPRLTPR